jgi:hypothetical protein
VVFYFVLVSVISGFYHFNKIKKTKLKYFLFFLVYVLFFAEALGTYIGKHLNLPSFWVYNTYIIINFLFYFYLFSYLFHSKLKRKIMKICLYVFSLLYLYLVVSDLQSFFYDLNLIMFFSGSFALITTIIFYLIELLNKDSIIFDITKFLPFWISIGNLLFFIGIIPIMIMRNYLDYSGLYDVILRILNVILYGSFAIGFILADKKYLKNIK